MNFKEIEAWLLIQKEKSFDFTMRYITFQGKKTILCFLNSLTDELMISYVLQGLIDHPQDSFDNALFIGNVAPMQDLKKIMVHILSGLTAIFMDGSNEVLMLETRKYPNRGVSEPETEKSIRASRDGFIEGFLTNVALIRRRIRDPHLRIDLYQFGKRTNCDIAMVYIEDLLDDKLLEWSRNMLDTIDHDTDIINERQFSELIFNSKLNPYPLLRYTERVDIAAIHLLQGRLLIIVDNSPSVLILPTTFFEQSKQIEEYTQTPLVGTMLRGLRYVGIMASIYLLPVWVLLISIEHYNAALYYVPTVASVPLYGVQILTADFAVELLRLAMIHSPSMLTSVIGIVAAFLLGQMAVDLGAFTMEILLYVALANIGNFVTPGYELAMANKLSRIFMIITTMLFGWIGFIAGALLHIVGLARTKSAHLPYLYPLFPFDGKELLRVVFRFQTFSTDKNRKTEAVIEKDFKEN